MTIWTCVTGIKEKFDMSFVEASVWHGGRHKCVNSSDIDIPVCFTNDG